MGLLRSDAHSTRWWAWASLLVALAGIAGSVFAAQLVVANERDDNAQAFRASAAEISASLQLDLRHEEDLVVNATALIVSSPSLTTSKLQEWITLVKAFERYPELVGLAEATWVPADRLDAFVAQLRSDPPTGFDPNAPFEVLPPGPRPYYCLTSAVAVRALEVPANFDYCAAEKKGATSYEATRDSGETTYSPTTVGDLVMLTVAAPIYRGGAIPPTVEERRAAFLGWIGTAIKSDVVFARAIGSRRGMVAEMVYDDVSSHATFSSGARPRHAQTTSFDLHNGWTISVSAPASQPGMLSVGAARSLVAGGIATSLLVSILLFVLATGRARALKLVADATDELRHQALHDPLTGLANRALVADRVDQLLVRSRRNGATPAALYVDLDGFKNVNDTLGHEVGDRLLVAVADRLRRAVRGADTISRMGGDEFLVLLDGATMDVAPELVAERLLDVLRQPFEGESDAALHVSASIGIAIGDRATGDDLFRDADVALYEAKASGRNRYALFHPEMQTAIQHGVELEFELRSALERDEYRLLYQPIYNLADLSLVGVEALLRWEHPTFGTVQPDEFIPILERTGQIVEVGRWVLDEACREMAAWHEWGAHLMVSVNVSPRQFDTDAIVDLVRDALTTSGLPASSLTIEVTESAIMRSPRAGIDRLSAIKALGVQVAIDDFGTGYSSLASLQQLPVDSLKIDRSFVSALADAPEARALVRTIVQLGKDLGLRTLAEGVETTEQVDELRGDHIDEAQGFLLSRPVDAETIERTILLAGHRVADGDW